jgi:hypothetical protein
MVNLMPQLDVKIENLGIDFCDVVIVIHNIKSDSYGFVSPIGNVLLK